jgi:alpha-galactosidase
MSRRSETIEQEKVVRARRVSQDVSASDLDHDAWTQADTLHITRYWSGEEAPLARQSEARILWTSRALCVRFVCRQGEPLVINETPQTVQKTLGLWERDVCEIFVAPDGNEPERYFEFEAAPTGEWLDLGIRQLPDKRETDWELRSGMMAAARIENARITIAMSVPWSAFGREPLAGERWRVNLFRCVGAGPDRGYLAWQPTYTERPNFHVPQAFGQLSFHPF